MPVEPELQKSMHGLFINGVRNCAHLVMEKARDPAYSQLTAQAALEAIGKLLAETANEMERAGPP